MIEDYGKEWEARLSRLVLWICRCSYKGNSVIDDIKNEALMLAYVLMNEDKIYPPLVALKIIKEDLIDIFVRSRAYNDSYGGKVRHLSYESVAMECIINERIDGISIRTNLVAGSFEDALIDSITLKDAMVKCLDDKERRVIELYLKGYNQREIAECLPIGRSRVSVLLKIIRGKLKEELRSLDVISGR